MGAVRFSIDSGLVRELVANLPLKVFVETGTYKGAAVRAMLPFFKEVHTIEFSVPLYAGAFEEFEENPAVRVYHGRSEQVLKEIVPELRRRKVLYWLDAHWCDETSAGKEEQCPLLEELEAIGSISDRSVVMIDDARLFMAPPPKPAVTEGWPQFSDVLERLSALNSDHELLVIDDVLVFFPPAVREPLRDYAHHHAVDWLSEMQVSSNVQRRLEGLRRELADIRAQSTEQMRERTDRVYRQIGDLARTVEGLEQKIDELGEQSQQSRESTEPQLESVFESLAGLRGRLTVIAERVNELSESRLEPQAITELIAPLGTHLSGIEEQVEPLGTQLERLREQLTALQAEVPETRGETASLGQKVDAFGAELEQLRPRVDRILNRQAARSEATLAQLRGIRKQMRALQERLDEKENRPRFARIRGFFNRIGLRLFGPRLGTTAGHKPRELKIPRRYRRQSPPDQPPAISIVTPTDAKPALLDRTIQSVLDQGYEPLEYIVENSSPAERTEEVLSRYRGKVARLEAGNGKPVTALNDGLDAATGEVLGLVVPDRLLLPGALTYVARYFEHHPDVDVVYGHRVLLDAQGKEVGRWVLPKHRDEVLSWADFVPTETLFWRRRVWDAVGGQLNEDLTETADWDLLLRFREVGARMKRVPRFLGAARIEDASSMKVMTNGDAGEVSELRNRVHGRDVSDTEASREIRGYLRRHVMLQKLYRLHLLRY